MRCRFVFVSLALCRLCRVCKDSLDALHCTLLLYVMYVTVINITKPEETGSNTGWQVCMSVRSVCIFNAYYTLAYRLPWYLAFIFSHSYFYYLLHKTLWEFHTWQKSRILVRSYHENPKGEWCPRFSTWWMLLLIRAVCVYVSVSFSVGVFLVL